MPYRTLCGFPTTDQRVKLLVPNRNWRPDTVVCDEDGTEWFVLMECDNSMRSYEAIFGDMYGHKLCCVRRKMMRQVWNDGFYICTYKPNFPNQPPLYERDCNNKKVYPFSYLEVNQQKGKFAYKFYEFEDGEMKLEERPKLVAQNGWLGFMTIWCTPMTRCSKWTTEFRRPNSRESKVICNQWNNLCQVEPGQDVLAGLCMAYIFDVCQRQPFVTLMGKMDPEYDVPDDGSLGSDEDWDDSPEGDEREKKPLRDISGDRYEDDDMENSEITDNPEDFEDEGLEPPSTGEEGEKQPPKPKKKKKKKRPQGKYPPAEPDEDAFADCLE